MNQTQIRYCRTRATEILNEKRKAIREKHTVRAVTLSATEKLKAFKAGKYSVLPLRMTTVLTTLCLKERLLLASTKKNTIKKLLLFKVSSTSSSMN